MATKHQFSYPDIETIDRPSAFHKDGNAHTSCRWHFLVVEHRENRVLGGPVVSSRRIPVDAELEQETEIYTETTLEGAWEETLSKSFSSTLRKEWSQVSGVRAKLGYGSGSTAGKGELSEEVTKKLATELTRALSHSVASKQTYRVVDSKRERSLTRMKVPAKGAPSRVLIHHVNVFPVHWDVYLLAVDVVAVEYKGLAKIGHGIKRRVTLDERFYVNLPVARITGYVAQRDLDAAFDEYTPDVPDAQSLEVVGLTEPCPRSYAKAPREELAEAARVAFPETVRENVGAFKTRPAFDKRKSVAKKAAKQFAKKSASQYPAGHVGKTAQVTGRSRKTATGAPKTQGVAGAKPAVVHGKPVVVKGKALPAKGPYTTTAAGVGGRQAATTKRASPNSARKG